MMLSRRVLLALLLTTLLAGGLLAWWLAPAVTVPSVPLQFVGTAACTQCHGAQNQAWQGSHHALAMQRATPATVLAPFAGERFTHAGVTSTFRQQDGRFYVRTDGHDGKLGEFEVTHTLGVTPLQQYLIPVANGGMQALGIAWDARPRAQGGQHWFQLQAGEHIKAGDELHWTGRQQNFNFMCAECHVTQFKKNFNPETRTFASTWSEMRVACEACHGPGSGHVAWAAAPAGAGKDGSKGLALKLDDRQGVHWTIDPQSGNAVRSPQLTPAAPAAGGTAARKEPEMCARCHAHRSQFGDDYAHGKPLQDTHAPSLLVPDLYWRDGQMRAEVFNYASFLQSKMAQKGVTCSDCHDPHTAKLKAPGNQVCAQCHAVAKYDAPSHHFHPAGSPGAACANCHMPTTTYMTVDPRHDHSIRVPRPDLSQRLGTPNACNQCHADKTTAWAAQSARRWYPQLHQRPMPLAEALHASDTGAPDARQQLLGVMADPQQPAMARASALARMPPDLNLTELESVRAMLADADPLLRSTAVDALAQAPAAVRSSLLLALVGDAVKGVRMAAARWLVGLPQSTWSAQDQARFGVALGEYIAAQQFNADRPESFNNLGLLYADQGDLPKAEAVLKQALEIAPTLATSSLNLADVYREMGREADAQALVRAVIQREPRHALAHHVLGLSLHRQHRSADALAALQQATRLEPGNARYAYVYAAARDEYCRKSPKIMGEKCL
jgi:predicted CXXCH cytochrome family protein